MLNQKEFFIAFLHIICMEKTIFKVNTCFNLWHFSKYDNELSSNETKQIDKPDAPRNLYSIVRSAGS
jgi:hypothetical protein